MFRVPQPKRLQSPRTASMETTGAKILRNVDWLNQNRIPEHLLSPRGQYNRHSPLHPSVLMVQDEICRMTHWPILLQTTRMKSWTHHHYHHSHSRLMSAARFQHRTRRMFGRLYPVQLLEHIINFIIPSVLDGTETTTLFLHPILNPQCDHPRSSPRHSPQLARLHMIIPTTTKTLADPHPTLHYPLLNPRRPVCRMAQNPVPAKLRKQLRMRSICWI